MTVGDGDVRVHEVLIAQRGASAVVTLARLGAMNAVNDAMRRALAEAFPGFARDPQIYAVVLRSAHPRAFSVGGDLKELLALWSADPASARASLADECRLVWLLECFSKPTVALIDGLVMGSGVGLTIHGTHRVAGAGYGFAMPETAVGFFPDVGVARVLARLPDRIGVFLGLTGRTIGRADALGLGLATHCVDAARFDEIAAGLVDGTPVDQLLDELSVDPGPAALDGRRELIARVFAADTVDGIIGGLEQETGALRGFADEVRTELLARSPTSLALTLRHIREAEGRDLRQTLEMDYRLGCHCLAAHDIHEGTRAMLIDRDRRPAWRPAHWDDVSDALTDRYFSSLGAGDLHLPTRQEMQQSRV